MLDLSKAEYREAVESNVGVHTELNLAKKRRGGRQVIDRTGMKYGRLTVVSQAPRNKHGHTMWNVRCSCGTEKVISSNNIATGTKSCGCRARMRRRKAVVKAKIAQGKARRGRKVADLVGERFSKLVVVSRAAKRGSNVAHWLCKCDCGKSKMVAGRNLRKGHTKSCGCLVGSNGRKKLPSYVKAWRKVLTALKAMSF